MIIIAVCIFWSFISVLLCMFLIDELIPQIIRRIETHKIIKWKKNMKKMDKYRIQNFVPYF
jgi:hypothetical protein